MCDAVVTPVNERTVCELNMLPMRSRTNNNEPKLMFEFQMQFFFFPAVFDGMNEASDSQPLRLPNTLFEGLDVLH